MLAATDEGIKRIESSGGRIAEVKAFPDSAEFVDSSTHLFPADDGLYIAGEREIRLLKIT